MKHKKNIERLFQEAFKDFEATPTPVAWDKLQEKLTKKERQKRKVIPLWMRFAGVAALLLLFFTLGNSWLNTRRNSIPTDVVTSPSEETSSPASPKTTLQEKNTDALNTVTPDKESAASTKESIPHKNEEENNPVFAKPENTIANEAVVSNNVIVNKVEASTDSQNQNLKPSQNTTLSNKNSATNSPLHPDTISKDAIAHQVSSDSKTQIVPSHNDTERGTKDTGHLPVYFQETLPLIQLTAEDKMRLYTALSSAKVETDKASVEKALADILLEMNKNELTIEEAIAKANDTLEKEKEVNRWQVYANIAPVYYNTLGNGSHIHDQFIHNPKKGEVNTSYGVNVGYALNNKITVRTGVSSLNLSYGTTHVILYENVGIPNAINQFRNLNLVSGGNAENSFPNVMSGDNLFSQQMVPALAEENMGTINQEINYIEVPVELQYNLIDKKFNLQLSGGFSTFFLSNNEIYTETENRRNYIGKANNINDISFSTNIGIGFGYTFSNAFRFNLEPTFKYQLNAYNNTSGNFKPYIIGVYTGLSYKF